MKQRTPKQPITVTQATNPETVLQEAAERLASAQATELAQIAKGQIPDRYIPMGDAKAGRAKLARLALTQVDRIAEVLDKEDVDERVKATYTKMALEFGWGQKEEKVLETPEVLSVVFKVAGRYVEPSQRKEFIDELMTEIGKL
jgi:hypothetical protein